MEYVIYDLANGILQWQGEATDADDAWAQFRADVGYSHDEPGLIEREKFLVETKDDYDNAGCNP